MNYSKQFVMFFSLLVLSSAFLAGCAGKKIDPAKAPLAKITKVADGGVYAEIARGAFEIGSSVTISKKDCKDIPVRGGAMKNCSNFEYGSGRVERQLEDGHLFIRSDAVSVPIGAEIRPADL